MTSTGRYHNIFVYYRGPSSAALTEHDANKQLEDNATKALINVMELGSPELARSFAQRFAPAFGQAWPSGQRAVFYLQGGPENLTPGPRVLVGISVAGEIGDTGINDAVKQGSRIDAAIVPPHGGLLAIETKVVDLLDRAQLDRHAERWDIAPEDVSPVAWSAVWEWARGEGDHAPDPVSEFLISQFCEYLAILGFGQWAGFRPEDFEQFTSWSWEQVPIIRSRVKEALERALELMSDEDAEMLRPVESGRFPKGAETAWAQTNRGQPGANVTVQLGADGLQLNTVGWTHNQASRLADWLANHAPSAPDLELIVYQRNAVADHKGKPFWMRETDTELMRFSPTEVRAGGLSAWTQDWHASADHQWSRLAYHLRHTWHRDQVIARGELLANDIAERITQMLPLLRAVNGWPQPEQPTVA